MSVNIISWNVRGLNRVRKRRLIKSLILSWKAEIFCFQESKIEGDIREIVKELWGHRWVKFAQLEASGTRGGKTQEYTWHLSAVYAPNDRKKREEVWWELAGARDLELGDIQLSGGEYTWRKGDRHIIAAILDRFLISADWNEDFRNIKQSLLQRVTSDHFPLMLQCGSWDPVKSYFKFENWWLHTEGFKDRIEEWWNSFTLLEELHDRRNLTEEEICTKTTLTLEFEEIANHEEVAWRQRSRALWLKEGDKNTKFFHRTTNAHRKFNNIAQLIVEVESLQNPEDIKREEIWDSVKACAGDKAPGPDGFTMAFFTTCWEVVKKDVVAVVQIFYEQGIFEKSLNATFVALIPKKLGAKELRDFRPISLIGSIYKIISKLLTERLKKVVNKLVDSQQMAFIRGRQIMDIVLTVLIVNECIGTRKTSREPWILCKLDIEKAYDHLN
uniref:Uncharacterized protein LOC104214730 n=1 Tax=Nicotiana sylvestris TaxID=4096 RepID=A0A1U7VCT5_NICSY|nr:PREDICTED: uncharacterized protein LOC104214730 [Nicotiana sylvestris]